MFKIKYHVNGIIGPHKARFVVKGVTQCEGIDYKDTFALVAKLVTIRCLLAIVVVRLWLLHQMDM